MTIATKPETKTKTITMSQAIRDALAEEMRRDENVFLIGEDIGPFGGTYGVTKGLWDEFKDRIFETPISEFAPAAMSIGAAIMGKRPVMEVMFGDFFGYTYSPVLLDAAKSHYVTNGKSKVPVVYRSAQGGFVSSGCHHSNCIEGWINNHPGIYIVTPSTAKDAKGLLKAAIREDNPVIFLEHKLQYAQRGEVPVDDYVIPLGKADVVKEGTDITVVAWQVMRNFVEKVIPELEKDGISVELIDPRTIRPFDYETLNESVKKTGRLLIVHEHTKIGGVGESIAANVQHEVWESLKQPIEIMGQAEVTIPMGFEERHIYPNQEEIAEKIREMVKK